MTWRHATNQGSSVLISFLWDTGKRDRYKARIGLQEDLCQLQKYRKGEAGGGWRDSTQEYSYLRKGCNQISSSRITDDRTLFRNRGKLSSDPTTLRPGWAEFARRTINAFEVSAERLGPFGVPDSTDRRDPVGKQLFEARSIKGGNRFVAEVLGVEACKVGKVDDKSS